ncbi:MAG TPA: ABC transporter permease, partial [Gemmatimonadaceae bacterium]
QLLRRLASVLRGKTVERDMDAEMAFHLEMEEAEHQRGGLPPDEARRRARHAFGGVERFRAEGRDARGVGPARDLAGDLRFGLRILRRSPVFTTVAVGTLALGIGVNSAIFSVVNAVLLQPLPFPDTRSLVSVWDGGHSLAEFTYIRDRARTLESVATYFPNYGVSLSGTDEPMRLTSAQVSAGFFDVLRVGPMKGRFFIRGEDAPGADRVVVISHALWRDRFGADANIIGRPIEIDGMSRQVIGVAPPGFNFPSSETRLWIPLLIDPTGASCTSTSPPRCVQSAVGYSWGAYGHQVIGRLEEGASTEQARLDVYRVGEALQRENPIWRPAMPEYLDGLKVSDLRYRLVKDSQRLLYVLLGAVGLVLAMACANVANLLVVRGAARTREMSIRAAIGAGHRRLARQLFLEHVLLATLGGAAGLLLAIIGVPVLVSLLPSTTPRLEEVRLDGWVVAFTMAATALTAILSGIAPARRLARTTGLQALGNVRSGVGAHHRRLAGALVSAQIAIGVMLAIGAGLLVRSLARIMDVDPGFATEQVVTAQVNPPRARYAAVDRQRALVRQTVERLAAAPGVIAAGVTTQLPFDQTNHGMAMWIDGFTTDPNKLELFELRKVSPDFFKAMGIPLRQGRFFNDGDRADGAPVAILSETAAKRYWSGRQVVGGQLRFPWPGWMSVVGVVADIRNNDLKEAELPAVYVPFDQNPEVPFAITVRSNADPAATTSLIRSVMLELAGDTPLSRERTMGALVEDSVLGARAAAVLLLGFGVLALLLGSIGTYGLVAYGVEARQREFAVRMAVGASATTVMRLVLRDGARLAVVGVVIGVGAALALTGLMRGLLFEVAPTDPVTFTAAPLLLAVTAMVACAIPAWRATRVDPNATLRRE